MRRGPLNKTLLTGGEDGVIRLWDVETGKIIAEAKDHKKQIQHLSMSEDKTHFYLPCVAGQDGEALRLHHPGVHEDLRRGSPGECRDHLSHSRSHYPRGWAGRHGGDDDAQQGWASSTRRSTTRFSRRRLAASGDTSVRSTRSFPPRRPKLDRGGRGGLTFASTTLTTTTSVSSDR